MTHTPDILPLQLIPSEFNTTNVNIMVNPFQICEVTEPGKDIHCQVLHMYMHTIIFTTVLLIIFLGIYSGAKCTDDLMNLVLEKNRSRVVLGGLQPSQSYLFTATGQWQISRNEGSFKHYSIQEVRSACASQHDSLFTYIHTLSP